MVLGWSDPGGGHGQALPPSILITVCQKYLRVKISKAQGFSIALLPRASQSIPFSLPEITMANVNLSRMTVEALMDLRKRIDEMLLGVVPRLKSSWRGLPWLAALVEAVEAH